MGSVQVWFTSFYVQAVIPTMLAKPLGIHPHVYVSTWSVIGPFTFSDIYIILHHVALFVLMSDLTSWITPPQLFNLKSKKLPTFNRRNLRLITIFIMLIKHLPLNAYIVLLLLFV